MSGVIQPIGEARRFLRHVAVHGRAPAVTDEEARHASSCLAAGYLQREKGLVFSITEKGRAYLARLARSE